MKFKKTLVIAIPTYNRKNILNIWLKKHIDLMQSNGVHIHIQDNNSSDKTVYLLKSWQKKYSNLSFSVNKKNLKDKNFEVCINSVNANFVWLIGDSYYIPKNLLDKVFHVINNNSPLFILTNLKGIIKNLNDGPVDSDIVFERLSGILSCISCTIYNKEKLGKIKFKEVTWSRFAHTIYILNQLKTRDAKAYWISSSINNLQLKIQNKVNWANTDKVFQIGCKNWIQSIDYLKGFTNLSKKKSYRLFSEATNLFNFKGGLWLRAQGLLSFSIIKCFRRDLKKSVGEKYLLLYIIALIPVFILKNLKDIYNKYRL